MVILKSASDKCLFRISLVNSQDWNGLIELLDDAELETLAENVKHALSCI